MPSQRPSVVRRVLDHQLPGPFYAAVGLVDRLRTDTGAVVERISDQVGPVPLQVVAVTFRAARAVTTAPESLVSAAHDEYDALVDRGQVRSVEIAAEQAVRRRVSRFEDRIAPPAARAAVRWNERRHRWKASSAGQRTEAARLRARAARDRAREAAERFEKFNAPVLLADPPEADRE